MKTCTNCGKKRKIKADWCKCEHTNDVFVLEQRELDRIDEKFKAPENAGCGKWNVYSRKWGYRSCGELVGVDDELILCPNCKNAGDDHSQQGARCSIQQTAGGPPSDTPEDTTCKTLPKTSGTNASDIRGSSDKFKRIFKKESK